MYHTLRTVFQRAQREPELRLQVCIVDGTPGGWRPPPGSVRVRDVVVVDDLIVLEQDGAPPHAPDDRLIFVPLSYIAWASIVDTSRRIESAPVEPEPEARQQAACDVLEHRYIHSLMNAEVAE